MPKIHPQKSQVEMADMEMVEINGAESSANAGITSTAMMLSMTSTTLPKAVRDGRRDLVPLLLNRLPKGSRKLNERDKDGFAAIHYAARFNRPYIMNQLLSALPDTNVKTRDGLTALHFAARHLPRSSDTAEREGLSDALSSSRDVIRSLLQAHKTHSGCKPTNITIQNPQGITPLHMACSRGNLPAAEELVRHDCACVNVADYHGDSPLHEACLQGNVHIVKILLDNGADLTATNKDYEIPLHVACKEGHVDVVKELLKPGRGDVKSMVSARDNEGNTPVHLAVESGVFETVKVLLLLKADPNAKNEDEVFPIHVAAAQGYTDMAKVLLQYNDDVKHALDNELKTPLHHAAMHDQVPMIKFLMQKGADKEAVDEDSASPLLHAAAWGRPNAVKVLLQGGAQANTVDKDGKSAVYWAAEEGHVDVLNILLQHEEGIQLCSVTELYHHNTPLHIAAYKGQTEAMKTLITMMEKHLENKKGQEEGQDEEEGHTGVKLDIRNDENKTPLHLAALKGHLDIVKFLVRKNQSSMGDEDEDGNTPLHLAAKYGRVEVADYLIDAGAEVDARNSRLWTPLDIAADTGCTGIISLLIDAEAPLDAKDKSSRTPLFLACRSGHLSAVQILLENGADVSVRDEASGFNCLDIAVEKGHMEVAMAIINGDSWKEALRNAVGHETPMRRMIHKLPDVAHAVLDRCMSDNATEENPDIVNSKKYEVTFDFEFLEDWRPAVSTGLVRGMTKMSLRRGHVVSRSTEDLDGRRLDAASSVGSSHDSADDEEKQSTRWKPEGFSRVHHPLLLMVRYTRGELLRHPVVSALLERKWRKYGRTTFIVNLLTYLLFLLFLTLYALLLPHPDHRYCRNYSVLGVVSSLPRVNETCPWYNLTFAQGDPTVPMTLAASIVLYISAGIVLVLGGSRLVLELLQAFKRHYRYLLNVENYIENVTYVFAIIFVIQFGMNCWCPTSWQWQLGALSVFFAWINLILFLKRVPLLGIYVLMYTSILYTFCRVVIIAFLFVIAFSLTFYMILYRAVLENGDDNITPLRTPGLSIIKTMVMTIGEFEYDTIFANSNESRDQLTAFAGLAYFLWIIFLILMPILLINLLVGLAVDDTKAIQDEAHLKRIGIQVNLTLEAEELWTLVPKVFRPDLNLRSHTIRPNRRLNPWELFKDNWGVERWDSVDNIQKYRKPDLNYHLVLPASLVDHIKAQTEELATELKELKTELASKNHTIEELLRRIAKKQGINIHDDPNDPAEDSLTHNM